MSDALDNKQQEKRKKLHKISNFAAMLEELERKHGYMRNDIQLIRGERRSK